MSTLISSLYFIVGLINFAPIAGVLSASRLESLYGLAILDADLILLMRHRAVLLGIVGCLLFYATFVPSARPIAAAAGFASMISYLVLIWMSEAPNFALVRVMWVDVAAIALLALACALDTFFLTDR